MAFSRTFRATPFFLICLCVVACQSQSGPSAQNVKTNATTLSDGSPGISVGDDSTQQPRTATYNCADGARMTIENLGNAIRVLGQDGALDEELPASPANQSSRFGAEHDAVVIDGRDALIMKGGHTPITCRR